MRRQDHAEHESEYRKKTLHGTTLSRAYGGRCRYVTCGSQAGVDAFFLQGAADYIKKHEKHTSPRSRSQVEPYDFCACIQKLTHKEGLFLDLE
jgi:hypothetical protein